MFWGYGLMVACCGICVFSGLYCGAGVVGDAVGGGELEAFERRGIFLGIIQFFFFGPHGTDGSMFYY